MNRDDFNRIIHNSGSVDRQMVGEVRELIDLFPYFQSAHLLLLKGLHNTSDVRFESQLKQSAIHVADREVLYHLLNRKPETLSTQEEEIKPVPVSESVAPDTQQTVIESGKNSEELIRVLSSSGLQHSLLVNEESKEDDSANIVFLLDDEDEQKEEKIIYMDPSIYVPGEEDLLELDLEEERSPDSEARHSSGEKTKPDITLSRKLEQADLIDKFIIANPRIETNRDKSDVPVVDLSKPITEESGGFITETLAKIYVTQGYYSKAIDIYQKLSLKFPEKSSYFATQIEKVQELIK